MNTPHISIEVVNHKANVDAWAENPDELNEMCSMLLCGLATSASDPIAWITQRAVNAAASLTALKEESPNED